MSKFYYFIVMTIVALIVAVVSFTLIFITAEYQSTQALTERQEAQRVATIERQCSLAWPLKGDRYTECLEQLGASE